jgi:O-antigen ligase
MYLDMYRAAGLIGAAVFVAAYLANQARWLSSEDWRFPAANLAGALLILISLFAEWNLPSVVIEGFWAAISLYGLVNRPRPG